MQIQTLFTVAAAVTFAVSSFMYVSDTAKSKIQPSIATFFILTLVNFSQLLSLISKNVWHVVPFTSIGLLQAVAVLILAIKGKKSYFKLPDKIALAGAFIGFIVWLITKNAAYNIYIINIVTVITFTPLIIKSFKTTSLETKAPWFINLLASTFLLLTISSSSPYVWIVPVRQFLCSLLINVGIFKSSKTSS